MRFHGYLNFWCVKTNENSFDHLFLLFVFEQVNLKLTLGLFKPDIQRFDNFVQESGKAIVDNNLKIWCKKNYFIDMNNFCELKLIVIISKSDFYYLLNLKTI